MLQCNPPSISLDMDVNQSPEISAATPNLYQHWLQSWLKNYAAAAAYLNKTLIPSGEALGIGWSRNMLYSGFTTLPRSVVRRQIGFTVRIIRTLCRRPSDMRLRSVDRRLLKPLGQPSEQGDAPLQSPDPLTIITWATWTHHLSVSGRRSTPRSSKLARH